MTFATPMRARSRTSFVERGLDRLIRADWIAARLRDPLDFVEPSLLLASSRLSNDDVRHFDTGAIENLLQPFEFTLHVS